MSLKFMSEVEGLKEVIFFPSDQSLQSGPQNTPAEPSVRQEKPLAFFCLSILSLGRWDKAIPSTKFIQNVLVLQAIT